MLAFAFGGASSFGAAVAALAIYVVVHGAYALWMKRRGRRGRDLDLTAVPLPRSPEAPPP